jgi:hypothetical protein
VLSFPTLICFRAGAVGGQDGPKSRGIIEESSEACAFLQGTRSTLCTLPGASLRRTTIPGRYLNGISSLGTSGLLTAWDSGSRTLNSGLPWIDSDGADADPLRA